MKTILAAFFACLLACSIGGSGWPQQTTKDTTAMSTQYRGDERNVNYLNAFNVLFASDTTPIGIISDIPSHGLKTGDIVHVNEVTNNTNANGQWVVNVTGANTFQLIGSTATGAGPGGVGTVQPLAVESAAIPSDGDDASAASVNVALQDLFDRTAAMFVNTGGYKLAMNKTVRVNAAQIDTLWVYGAVPITDADGIKQISGTSLLTLDEVVAGDIVEVTITGTVETGGSVSNSFLQFSIGVDVQKPGTSGTFGKLLGSGQLMRATAFTISAMNLHGQFTAPWSGSAIVWLACKSAVGVATVNVAMIGDYAIIMNVWRPTGFAQ